ncbi:hypothetical protein C8R44DRAFT_880505 [Mycena epipterygia]|nr:hypothetical protein C8R44DRAFT_880505 [Mycena epipterygia]
MPSTKTIAAVSQPRHRRQPSAPRAPITDAEKAQNRADSAETKAQIDEAMGEWWASSQSKAIELGERFGKKPRYFLDIMFQGGARMVNHHEKINPYNAFKSEKAAQAREKGLTAKNVTALHEEHWEEYSSLSAEEKSELVERFMVSKGEQAMLRRDSPRARMQDVSNTVRNLQMLFHGLSYRVGIEGFFCIVRNTSDFHMAPQWYFSSQELERYMPLAVRKKWDTGEKADFLKVEIRQGIHAGLVAITKNPKAEMSYFHFDEDIMHRYGIDLVGWTADRRVSPSDLSSSLAVLTTLRNAINNGVRKWVKLTPEDLKARKKKWAEDVAAGRILRKSRSTRADKGKKRKRAAVDEEDEGHNDGDDSDPEEPDTPTNDDAPTYPALI